MTFLAWAILPLTWASAVDLVMASTSTAAADLYAATGMQRIKGESIAPSFALKTMDGQSVNSESLRGKVVMINFWATWCGPCREEMPALQRLRQRFKANEFELLAVTTEQQKEAIDGFVKALGLTFPIVLDETTDVSAAFGVRGLPTTVLIGKNGQVLGRAVGPRGWDSREAVSLIRSVMEPVK
ncbi:MAG: TlpA family protein disulfide reductase [Nitrospiraceae bacterium]